jgi:tetratricopeptide (TPR) repeat protein
MGGNSVRKSRELLIVVPALAALALSGLSLQAAAETPLAILLATSGEVKVVRAGGETVDGEFGMPLSAGDIVKTGPAGGAEILMEDGTALQIGANSNMQIKRPGKKSAATPGSFETVQNFLKLKNSEGTSSLSALRSRPKVAELRAESPCQTKIRERHPTFVWTADDPATEVRVTLYNEDGIVWKYELSGATQVEYPPDAPALEAGVSYSWIVETIDPLLFPPLRSQNAYFELLDSDQAKQLDATLAKIDETQKPGEAVYHVVRASVFYGYGLVEDAIRETNEAARIDSSNPALRTILARLYADAGRTSAALGEYDQLLEKR